MRPSPCLWRRGLVTRVMMSDTWPMTRRWHQAMTMQKRDGQYPHNRFGQPVRPKTRFETRTGMGYAPADPSWAYHQPHIWLEGQDPQAAEFIDVIYGARTAEV